LDTKSGYAWIFDGNYGYQDLWKFRTSTNVWTRVNQGSAITWPEYRYLHKMEYDGARNRLLMFGGASSGYRTNQLYEYALSNNRWTLITGSYYNSYSYYTSLGAESSSNTPGGRYEFGMVSEADKMYVLCGQGYYAVSGSASTGYLNDIWSLNKQNDSWAFLKGSSTQVSSFSDGGSGAYGSGYYPSSRYQISATIDTKNRTIYMFGGYEWWNGVNLNDMWAYNIPNNQWAQLSAYTSACSSATIPYARSRSSIFFDGKKGNVLMFGGYATCYGYMNDLRAFNPNNRNWYLLTSSANSYSTGSKTNPALTDYPGGMHSFSYVWDGTVFMTFFGYGYAATGGSGYHEQVWAMGISKAPAGAGGGGGSSGAGLDIGISTIEGIIIVIIVVLALCVIGSWISDYRKQQNDPAKHEKQISVQMKDFDGTTVVTNGAEGETQIEGSPSPLPSPGVGAPLSFNQPASDMSPLPSPQGGQVMFPKAPVAPSEDTGGDMN